MKKNAYVAWVALLLTVVAMINGCASGQQTVAALNQMNHIDQAISAFGPPSGVMTLPDGGSVYVWSSRSVTAVPTYQSTGQHYYGYAGSYLGSSYGGNWGSQTQENICEVRVMTTSSGRITSKSVGGNACP